MWRQKRARRLAGPDVGPRAADPGEDLFRRILEHSLGVYVAEPNPLGGESEAERLQPGTLDRHGLEVGLGRLGRGGFG